MIDPVRPIAIEDIEQARTRIAGTILKTPLVKLELGPDSPEVHLKLENLQPTNAYKIRGGANAVARLSDAERALGVWTISAGNAGQGVAYAARQFGIPCTVVAIETAPQTKLDRMRALGATIVGFWRHGLHFFSLFVPHGTPMVMIPLIFLVEFISFMVRPFSLGLRLFVAMIAGHILMEVFGSFIVSGFNGGAVGWGVGILSFLFIVGVAALELLVCAIQAYVFALLTTLYLNDAINLH
jgi:hypothetical protein